MRWKKWVGGLALMLATAGGCKQQVFMTKCDHDESRHLLIQNLENNPSAAIEPVTGLVKAPPTPSDPDREMRYISLAEAISIGLEQGNTGSQSTLSILGTELANDALGSFQGQYGVFQDSIRVLRLDPARAGANIESALSKFDAVWASSAAWNTTDRPVGTSLDTFQSSGQINAISQQEAAIRTGVVKPLSTGGVAGITFRTDYTYTNLPSRVNPAYRPALQFAFEQPLLQGFGTEINEIRASHPGSIIAPGTFNTQPTAEGILLTRLRFDQQRVEFERNVHFLLLNVESAYWNLYSAYWNLYSRETGLRLAYESWRIFMAKFQAGTENLANLAQTRGQYELFRSQRLQALNDVLEAERQLRALLGMPIEDGTRLIPSDQPTVAPFQPDWTASLQEALVLKPELHIARQDVKAAQLNLIAARNNELPDIRLTATYDFNDIGSRLDGADASNAFRNLSQGNFSNWSVGLQGNIPLGFRDAHAKVRIAKLQLARSYNVVQVEEMKLQRLMARLYRLMDTNYNQIRIFRAQREAYGQQIKSLAETVKAGKVTPNILLEAQRFYADALTNEHNAIRDYNKVLVGWEFMKGTIMQHDNVAISEGMLPGCAQVRAVEHQRERTAAIVLRERAQPVHHEPIAADCNTGVLPLIPPTVAPSLPALMKDTAPLPPVPEMPGEALGKPGEPSKLDFDPRLPAASKNDALNLPPASVNEPKPLGLPTSRTPSTFGTVRPVEPKPSVLKLPEAAKPAPTDAPPLPTLPPIPGSSAPMPR